MCASTSIERYVQNHVIGPVPAVSGVPEEETFFDGYSLGWWQDRAAFDETMASPGWKALEADGDNVFDMSWLEGMSAELREHTVIEGPSSPFKVVWMVRFKHGLSQRGRPSPLGAGTWSDLQGARDRPLRAEPRGRLTRRRAHARLRWLFGVLVQGRGTVPQGDRERRVGCGRC